MASALNLSGAAIREADEGDAMHPAPSIELPNQHAEYVDHIAIDIGGSLIKLVFFSPEGDSSLEATSARDGSAVSSHGGRLHFVKFETSHVEECIKFIEAKGLHRFRGRDGQKEMRVKATGGGAFKFTELFKERLGVVLEKEDEMSCLVSGCNFLLKAIHHEAFTYENSVQQFITTDENVFPYLLVNIGSGVSMVKVTAEGQYERVSGSSLGGGTFWGLCRLLTQCDDFDEILKLSMQGNNANVDMLVGDIYGGRDYSAIGLSADTIASSFGKVISSHKKLADYNPADICMALCRMVSYNIGQLAYLNAMRYNIKRIFFGGFFIRGHPYTMETISYAIRFWSKGDMAALFLRHEGFLTCMGAYSKVHPMTPAVAEPSAVRSRFIERFSMGAPFAGGQVVGPPISDLQEKVSWVERFIAGSAPIVSQRPAGDVDAVRQIAADLANSSEVQDVSGSTGSSSGGGGTDHPIPPPVHMALHVGVLHYSPSLEPFPLLHNSETYEPNTWDLTRDEDELRWWLKVLEDQLPMVVDKAIASEGGGELTRRRALAFGRAFAAHVSKLRAEPGAYGALGLSELLEMREECLREFGFSDAYRLDKERENSAALAVLGDLLAELDALSADERLLALVEGALAANIFDWGARACVELYQEGTILEIYREAREKLGKRPWLIDNFDKFAEAVHRGRDESGCQHRPPFKRVMVFVDNSGADIVLGMLPLSREFLKLGCDVVLVANSLPAINDITAPELRTLLSAAAQHCPVIRQARQAAIRVEQAAGSRVDSSPAVSRVEGPKLFVIGNGQGSPCLDFRRVPNMLAEFSSDTDLIIIEGMGRAIHTNYQAQFKCDALKLAMIKTERLAKKLFGNGSLYDCVCRFDPAE